MILIVILIVCATTYAVHIPNKLYYDLDDASNLFKEFLQNYGKKYNPEEYSRRFEIFKESLKEINELNANSQTEFGINHFTDLTEEETQRYFGFKPLEDSFHETTVKLYIPAEQMTAPDSFDWRDHNAVTQVKDQKYCGSCWIFSAIGNIEGQYALQFNLSSVELSEQQSLDCIYPYDGTSNCNGGWPHMVMYHDAQDAGVMKEKDYDYTGQQGQCRENASIAFAHVDSFTIYQPTEESLKQLLFEKGPLSVALQAYGLHRYKGGIFYGKMCIGEVNHAVLLVGYGEEKGVKYWIIKNSWSPLWGEKGYFRLERGVNACDMGTSYTATCTVK